MDTAAGEDGFQLARRSARLAASLLTHLGSAASFEITAEGVVGNAQATSQVTPQI